MSQDQKVADALGNQQEGGPRSSPAGGTVNWRLGWGWNSTSSQWSSQPQSGPWVLRHFYKVPDMVELRQLINFLWHKKRFIYKYRIYCIELCKVLHDRSIIYIHILEQWYVSCLCTCTYECILSNNLNEERDIELLWFNWVVGNRRQNEGQEWAWKVGDVSSSKCTEISIIIDILSVFNDLFCK